MIMAHPDVLPSSLIYRCVDLDSDGCIRPREMWFFYEEQLKRMENLPSAETVLFEDVVCQLHDMLLPEVEGVYTIRCVCRLAPGASWDHEID